MRTTPSLNFDLPHYLKELPNLLPKRGCTQAGNRTFQLRKSLWAAPSGNTGLQATKWKSSTQACKNHGVHNLHICYRHMDICLYAYLHTHMYMYRLMSIKYREALMYTTYVAGKGSTKASCPTAASRSSAGLHRFFYFFFSPTYHKNINA